MIDFPSNDKEYRYQINDPEKFKKTYKACEEVLKDYPKEIIRYKNAFWISVALSGINMILFGLNYISFWWFIGLGVYLVLGVFFRCWQIYKNEKLLKEANYVKEKLDFIISYNSTPLRGDEWKGPRDPLNL